MNKAEQMNTIRSHKHVVSTEEVNKVALSADDDERHVLEDKIHTLALGHYRYLIVHMPSEGQDL